MSKESFNEFFRSKLFLGIIAGVCITLIAVCVFEIGVAVGYHEASFSSNWGQNYGRNFGGASTVPGFPSSHLPTPDGILGQIISVSTDTASSTTLVISNSQKQEEKILLGPDTVIRDHENTVGMSDLTVGSYAVVVGTPNDQGQIEAKLIRVVPSP